MPRLIVHALVLLLVGAMLGCGGRRRSSTSRDGGMVACQEQGEAPVSSDGSFTYRGETVGSFDEGSCGGRGGDFVLRYEAPASGTLLLSTQSPFTEFDTVVYVRLECEEGATELACDDDGGGGTRSMTMVEVEAGDVVYIFVDGWADDDGGEFELTGTILMDDGGMDDAGMDAGSDAGMDGGFDGGMDAGMDAGFDGGMDAGTDAGFDGGMDAGFDGGMDAGMDAGFDGGMDAGTDAGGCPSGFADCNGLSGDGCEADLSAPATCGSCTNVCAEPAMSTATCTGATCGYTCDTGYADCNSSSTDGCEADLTTPDSCGSCSNVCPARTNATRTCTGTTCGYTCDTGYADCNSSSTDGCEADLTTPDSCGSCSNVCPVRANATRTCTGTTCGYTCDAGYTDCNGLATDGCEAHFATDEGNCGGCGIVCPGMQVCCSGDCRSAC